MSSPLPMEIWTPTLAPAPSRTRISPMPDRNTTEDMLSLGYDRAWLLGLANDLQRTLDIEELLTVFSRRASELVTHDHLRFTAASGIERFALGTQGTHACTYDMVLPDERLGMISFTRGQRFSNDETIGLEQVLLNLAYPLRNALLYEKAVRASEKDGLTGLGNRAAMETALARAFAAANRHGDALSLIILDVDFFKRVNDEHGHLVGDEVLKVLSLVLSDVIRETDIAFRYGGEEFLVILEKTDLAGASLLAERIRTHLESMELNTTAGPVRITLSLGVAMLEPGDSREALLGRADAALYASKMSGRNRMTTDSGLEVESASQPASNTTRA